MAPILERRTYPAASRRLREATGFTLIELMIVIGIMAIIVTMGVPPFVNAMRKEGLRKAVSDTVEGCSHARAQAILHGVPTELVIRANGDITVRPLAARSSDELGDREGWETRASTSGPATFRGKLPDDVAVKLLFVNFQDQMKENEAHVRFFPNGTCDEFTVILSCKTGERQISLDVITGLADVTDVRVIR